MTDSMVERVARVIIAGFDEVTEPDEREDCLNLARAAIASTIQLPRLNWLFKRLNSFRIIKWAMVTVRAM